MDNEYLDIIGLGIFKALNDKRYPILVNGKISESAIPTSITNSITSILSLIPDAASSENKLADKNFVNSSIATNTATFRGTFDDLATLQATSADINDYAFYVHTDEIGNTAYDRYKHNGSTWVFEYTLNNSSFTAEQWSAINSGITTTKVGNYDAHLINYSNPHKVTKSQVGLGNVENVALSSWAGSNKITTLGTITTGVWNGTKITNTYLANSSITIGTTAISLGSTAKSLAGIEKLQLNDANSNLVYDSTTGSWKLTGNLLVTGFISAGAKGNSSSGGGSTYTQREWAEIKIMSASEIGLLASAYSVKEAYNELNTAIETLAGKATNVKFTQTLTSGKQIGSISIDGKSTSLFAPANYAWGEITGKPTFATVATSGSYADLSNKPTIASLMGSAAIGGTSSFIYWNGSAWATKALGSNAFTSISKVSQLTNDSGYITGITKSMVEGVLTGNITSHTHSYIPLADKGLSNGKVPYYVKFPDHATLVSLGYNEESTAINDEAYFKGLCKWAIDNFAGQGVGQIILIGNAIPNSGGFCCIQLYSSGGKDATTGLPRYCSGTYISLDRATTNFGCINYIWTWGGSFYGNASSSSKWATARTITLTGSVTGSVSIDGSQNVSLATTTNHTHNYLPLTGGTVTGSLTINTYIDSSFILDEPTGEKYHKISFRASGEEYAYLLSDNHGSENKLVFNGSTILHSSNVGSYALPLSGGTLTGSVTMQGMNTNLIRNITYTSTSSWARGLINLQVDGISKFSISALGDYTLGASDNGINYAYIGCNSYDGLNLRISATSLSWGNSPILHSANYNSYALPLSGGTISGTNDAPLKINTTFSTSSIIFQNSGSNKTQVGWDNGLGAFLSNSVSDYSLCVRDNGTPCFYNGKYNTLIHSDNYNSYAPTLTGTGATGTWGISISGNAATATNADTLDGVHFQNILERETSGLTRGTDVGWYRIAETYQNNSDSFSFLLGVQRSYGVTNNETYLFSICISYRGRISITQLSGYANDRLIDKIRVDWGRNAYYIDLYINTATGGNTYRWYTVGAAKSYTAWTANPTLNGTAYEFTTVNGCKSDRGFTGDLTGNATTVGGITGALIPASNVSTGYWGSLGYGSSKKLSIGTNYGGVGWNAQNYCAGLMFGCELDTHGFISIGYNSPIVSFAGSNNSNASNDNPNWYFKLTGTSGTIYDLNCAPTATKLANSRTIWGLSFDGTDNVSGAPSFPSIIDINRNVDTGVMIDSSKIGFEIETFANDVRLKTYSASGVANPTHLVLTSGGNIGIGTTSPAYKLDVNGEMHAVGLRTNCIELSAETPFIDFHYNNSTADFTSRIIEGLSGQLTVRGKLRVGLGYTTSTDYAFHVVGTTYSTAGLITDGAISAAKTSTSSDIRLKDNISEIGSKTALQWLLMLKPKSWTWNDKAGVTGQSMGFVAQDVEGILPQMVKKQDNGYLSLDYTQLHALEVSALQSHEKRIEELERENKILKEEINKLKQYAN